MPESERAALAAPYDVEAVRKDFPILSREVYGKPLVYLDNGASAQNRRWSSTPFRMLIPMNTRMCIVACISSQCRNRRL